MSDWEKSSKPRSFSPWLLVVFIGAMMIREFSSGFHNLGMIASIAIAAGILFFFLAPEKFSAPKKTKSDADQVKSEDAEPEEK